MENLMEDKDVEKSVDTGSPEPREEPVEIEVEGEQDSSVEVPQEETSQQEKQVSDSQKRSEFRLLIFCKTIVFKSYYFSYFWWI